jgi:hypothetical protein
MDCCRRSRQGAVLSAAELSALRAGKTLLRPDVRDPKTRNISLNVDGSIKGVAGDEATQAQVAAMVGRFREQATALIAACFRLYAGGAHGTHQLPPFAGGNAGAVLACRRQAHACGCLSFAAQLWRAHSARLHQCQPGWPARVWRVGEPFTDVAKRFVPRAKPYSAWQAKALELLHVTKSYRSEYDHLMLQLHDGMKGDPDYQKNAPQETVPFAAGSTWVCFSDQAVHAVMSGQYMLEQTLFLPPGSEYNPRPARCPFSRA